MTDTPTPIPIEYAQQYASAMSRRFAADLVQSFAIGELPIDADVWHYFRRIPWQNRLWRNARAAVVTHSGTSKDALEAIQAEYLLD